MLIIISAIFSIFAMIEDASASHKMTLPCNVTIRGQTYPVHYASQPRNNPDGTYYPNDAFFYIMRYSASPTCIDLIVHPLEPRGLTVSSNIKSEYVDASSEWQFQDIIKDRCNSTKKYSGCISGIAVIDSCHDTDSGCMDNTKLVQKVTGLKKVCRSDGDGGTKCTIVRITRTATISPSVLTPDLDVILTKETIQDDNLYDARNLDGTYYTWDPIVVRHVPDLKWKNDRANTIHFETTRTPDLIIENMIECTANSCHKIMTHPGTADSSWSLGNGDGITMYNATDFSYLGLNYLKYHTVVTNAGVTLDSDRDRTDTLIVRYDPKYSKYPYPLLSDGYRTSYENRAAVALHYFGSQGGGPDDENLLHEDRRSKINDFYYVGAGFDPWNPVLFDETLVWSEVRDSGILQEHDETKGAEPTKYTKNPDVIPCETNEKTAMMVRAGYCRIFFDYDILDTVYGPAGPRYENATLFNNLISKSFAGYDRSYLSHYEYRFAEPLFHADIHVKSVGVNGTANPVPLSVHVMPLTDEDVQTLPAYIHEKVTYDSNDSGLGKIISGDVYPVEYSESGIGELDVKLYRVSSKFETYQNNDADLRGLDIISLAPLYLQSSSDARLDVPLDVGLGALSPVIIQVSVGNMTRQYQYDYVDFGRDLEIVINQAQDNVLDVSRSPGAVTVNVQPEFGEIAKLYVNSNEVNVSCFVRCTIPAGNDNLEIVVENSWGGRAHGMAPEFIPENIPPVSSSGFEILAAFALALPVIYWIHVRVKNRQ